MDILTRYAFIFIPDRSFAHIYDKEIAQDCLHTLFQHTISGGWVLIELKTPPAAGEFGPPGQTSCRIDAQEDGSTLFSTSIWSERDNGRVIRNWTKMERYVQGTLQETEIFDYNERFYARDEFMDMLMKAGLVDITSIRAYDGAEPHDHDVIVYICQKS